MEYNSPRPSQPLNGSSPRATPACFQRQSANLSDPHGATRWRLRKVVKRESSALKPSLASLGVPTELSADVMARINLGREAEFRDQQGRQFRSQVRSEGEASWGPSSPIRQPVQPSDFFPICCPKCGAVLAPRIGNETPRSCPMCGHFWRRVNGGGSRPSLRRPTAASRVRWPQEMNVELSAGYQSGLVSTVVRLRSSLNPARRRRSFPRRAVGHRRRQGFLH